MKKFIEQILYGGVYGVLTVFIFIAVLIVGMVGSIFVIPLIYAYVNPLDYTVSDGTATITKYRGREAHVVIPSQIDGYPVVNIGEGAYAELNGGDQLIPIIDDNLLESVVIPEGVTNIGAYAFIFCAKLTSVVLPDGLISIGKNAFAYGPNLKRIILPESLVSIGEGAFDGSRIETLKIPDSVTTSGTAAFATGVGTLEIGKGLAKIEEDTFYVGNAVTVDEDNCCFSSSDGVFFNKDKTLLIGYPYVKEDAQYKIPSTVTCIGSYAFHGNINLESIIIPESVTNVMYNAFCECEKLGSITIPDSVLRLGKRTFVGCSCLTNVVLGKGITVIPYSAFSECTNLHSIVIPAGVTNIEFGAFHGGYRSGALKRVYFLGDAPTIDDGAFLNQHPDLTFYHTEDSKGWEKTSPQAYLTKTWKPGE